MCSAILSPKKRMWHLGWSWHRPGAILAPCWAQSSLPAWWNLSRFGANKNHIEIVKQSSISFFLAIKHFSICLAPFWAHLASNLSAYGSMLTPSWRLWAQSWPQLGHSGAHVGRSWPQLTAIWAHIGPILATLSSILAFVWSGLPRKNLN